MTDYILVKNKDDTYTITAPSGMKFDFGSDGKLTKQTDENGKTISVSHGDGRTTLTEDISGKRLYLNHNDQGLLTSVTDDNGRKTALAYDADKNLTAITNTLGETVHYHYDDKHRIVSETGNGGTIVRNVYDGEGRVVKQTDASGNAMTLEYTTEGRNTKVTIHDMDGSIKYAIVDPRKQIIQNTNADGSSIRYTYDEHGNVTAISGTETTAAKEGISALSGTAMTYDAENNRIAMESDRHKETYVVDTVSGSLSRILTITEGSTTTLCIYGNGLICEKTGDIYQYHHYNNLGSTMKLTDAKGGVTASFTYGTYGELLSGSTGYTRFLYNGRCGVMTDDNGFYYMRQRCYSPEIKRFVNQDVIRGSLDNSQSLNRYSYVQGNPVSYTDPFGLSPLGGLFTGTTVWHGVLGLLGCIPGPVGMVANLIDDGMGNLTRSTDSRGHTTENTYNSVGNMTAAVLADGGKIRYACDALGHGISETDQEGNTTRFTYYPNGNLRKTTYPDGSTQIRSCDQAWKLMQMINKY